VTESLRGKTAIVGVGATDYSKNSERSVLQLAVEASVAALADSGLEAGAIDGIVTYGVNDTVLPRAVGTALGIPELRLQSFLYGGGECCMASIGAAAAAIATGQANNVIVYRAMNGRSEHRLGGTDWEDEYRHAAGEEQFGYPFGWLAFAQRQAMAARRHMIKYGTTTEDLGHIAVTFRENARRNERALMRSEMTLQDHQESRLIADPLRLFDVCIENDGACAIVLTRADAAPSLRRRPVSVLGVAEGGGFRPGSGYEYFTADELADDYSGQISPRLYEEAGVGPQDIDVVSLYDCFSSAVISQLEGFGFCPRGEAGPFVREGRIKIGADIPVNTHGGMLSEAYLHGMNGLLEVVWQLRGEAGERQVEGAEVGLASGFALTTGCALVVGVE
jgi:acetyl-CoA acetyltransferase